MTIVVTVVMFMIIPAVTIINFGDYARSGGKLAHLIKVMAQIGTYMPPSADDHNAHPTRFERLLMRSTSSPIESKLIKYATGFRRTWHIDANGAKPHLAASPDFYILAWLPVAIILFFEWVGVKSQDHLWGWFAFHNGLLAFLAFMQWVWYLCAFLVFRNKISRR